MANNTGTRWAVCPTCDGNGTHVNPAIDAHGITSDEMYELGEDFREDYISGVYDVPCAECRGRTTVPACRCGKPALAKERGYGDRRDRVTTEHYATCYDHLSDQDREDEQAEADLAAEMAAEARMGA